MSDAARTRLSFTHERAELRGQNPLYAKTNPVPFNDAANDSKEDRRAAFKSKRRGAAKPWSNGTARTLN